MIKNWRNLLKNDAKRKLRESKREFEKYNKTSRILYLQQACNKLFSAVENYLIVKYNKRVKNYQDLKAIVNKRDRMLLTDAAQLHYFYYNGKLQMPESDVIDYYERVYEKMVKKRW